MQLNDIPHSCLSDKSARRTRDVQWDTSRPRLSGDVSFLQDEGANHLEGMPASPNFWVALFPSVSRPSRETGSPERRQEPAGCLTGGCASQTEGVCTAHTSHPFCQAAFNPTSDQCLYDLTASVSPRGWLSPIRVTGRSGLTAAQKNQA